MILSSPYVPELILTISSASSKNESKSTFKPAVMNDAKLTYNFVMNGIISR